MEKPPRESSVEAALVRYAKERGIWTRKFSSPARRGVPDRIFMHEGRVLFLEVKRPGKAPSDLQKHEIAEICRHGGYATWCSTAAAGRDILDMLTRGILHPDDRLL